MNSNDYNYQTDTLWQTLEGHWLGFEFAGATSHEELCEKVVTALVQERLIAKHATTGSASTEQGGGL